MASNIDQIFQDFILTKIKEIHDRHHDKTAIDGSGPASEVTGAEEASKREKDDTLQSCSLKKKQKKSKKHKSKKKKKSRHTEEDKTSSESESGTKQRKRRETQLEASLEEDKISEGNLTFQKRHTSGKKKKRKRKKEHSSHSETEYVQESSTCLTASPRQAELPDIIPRQHSITRGRGQGEKDASQSSMLQSCPSRKNSRSRSRTRSRSRSRSRSRHNHRRPGNQSTACLKLDRNKSSSTQRHVKEDEMAESSSKRQSPDRRREPLETEERSATNTDSRKRKQPKAPERKSDTKSSERSRRSPSVCRRHRRRYRSNSRSPLRRRRSRSRSRSRCRRRSRSRSRSRSSSWERRRASHSQRDRRKQEPGHSSVAASRKRSSDRKHGSLSGSPQRISELDKNQLLEIAKANAAAMCANAATMTAALCNTGTLSSLLPLGSMTSVAPPVDVHPSILALEEVRRKISKTANNMSIKEFTDKCKMIVNSKEELPVAMPFVQDEENSWKPFSGSAHRDQKPINFNISSSSIPPTLRCDVGMAKEFPVSSGSQHRKKESAALDVYGKWTPVEKTQGKATALSKTSAATNSTLTSSDPVTVTGLSDAPQQPSIVADADCVFEDQILQSVDICQAVNERIKAQRRLAENPYDVNAMCMLNRAQEQVDAWAQSSIVPGFFTGSTGAQVLSSEDLSTSGPQAWLKKDQFLRATPVRGGVGEFLMRKMGWRTGEGLGRNRKGTVEPIIIDFKVDRKGLVANGEKPQKQTGGLVVTKDLMGKHPVSALIELCNKRRILQPEFVMVHHSGPDHRKNFLFKVTVNGVDYQPQAASPNKKHAKAMAATVALQALGEVAVDGPGLYTGPVFTAASTGPLFST